MEKIRHSLKEKAGAKCDCSGGRCKFVGKKPDFKCIPESVCPLPDFQGAKFNYVIDAEQGADWAYMRFRFRKILDNKAGFQIDAFSQASDWPMPTYPIGWECHGAKNLFENLSKFHPEWDNDFWATSPWTGIVACPFSSIVDGKRPLEGIYFESGSTAYDGRMHTIMGRSGHFLQAAKGETLRAALLTPNGAPWGTKFKGKTQHFKDLKIL